MQYLYKGSKNLTGSNLQLIYQLVTTSENIQCIFQMVNKYNTELKLNNGIWQAIFLSTDTKNTKLTCLIKLNGISRLDEGDRKI